MELNSWLEQSGNIDPTWKQAAAIVRRHLMVPTPLWRLIRGGWQGQLDSTQFMRLLGFCRVNCNSLVGAAEIKPSGDGKADLGDVEQALAVLGIRLSSVVLAINHTCRQILNAKPAPAWKALFEDTMTTVEIGYKLGARVPEIGLEGGAIAGFARGAAMGLILAWNPKAYRDFNLKNKHGRASERQCAVELFGCEPYQVSAFILQALGFGPELAVGLAYGLGHLKSKHLSLDPETLRWRAISEWLDALKFARNYPGDLETRMLFPEIAPSQNGRPKNLILEVLYTEVAKVRTDGSKWLWHLPKESYEASAIKFGLK